MDELLAWCVEEGHVGVRLVTGPGGAGKTRLALRLGEKLSAAGWQPLWVPRGAERVAVGDARELGRPCVLVVDYAETRDGLTELVAAAAGGDGPEVRVVLLARSAGEWWQRLISGADERAGDLLAPVEPLPLGPVRGAASQQEVLAGALAGFADMLGVAAPDVPVVLDDSAPVVLDIHAAALLAVLDAAGGGGRVRPGPEALDGVLWHEARYWAGSASARGLALDDSVLRLAVAVGCLIGAGSEAAAAELAGRIPDLADSARLRGQVARWLHDLYPIDAGDDDGEGWIGPLRPDPVAEHLVVNELASRQSLIPALFAGLSERRAAKALTVLARAALTHRTGVGLLRAALAADLEHLIVPALEVAVETNPVVGDLISDALAAQPVPAGLLERVAGAIPFPSFALAGTAVTVFRRLADDTTDSGERAGRRVSLSNYLSALGRREEALAVIEEAVGVYRELARASPDAFRPNLAGSLNNQSVFLADLGRREEALVAVEEAVTIRRELARGRPDAFRQDLAVSLNNQSKCLAELGRREEALAVIEEAVGVYLELARGRPDAFRPRLATLLNNQSVFLADLGRREEALAAIEEAVAIRRELALARPNAFRPSLASSLNNHSNWLAALGRREEALAAIEEAAEIYRELARDRPDAFRPDLAMALNNQSARLLELGRREEALAVIEQAAGVYRELARSRPDAFRPNLAASLNNQSVRLAELGRREEALAAIEEAVTIRRDLAQARPGVFQQELARSLDNLAAGLSALGRDAEAQAAREEAAELRERA